MRKYIIILLLPLVLLSCSKKEEEENYRIGFISLEETGAARNQILKGARKASSSSSLYIKEYTPKVVNNIIDQVSCMEKAIKDDCKIVVISPSSESQLNKVANLAKKNNIKLLTVRSRIQNPYITCSICSDINKIADDLKKYIKNLKNVKDLIVLTVNPYDSYYSILTDTLKAFCDVNNIEYRTFDASPVFVETKEIIEYYAYFHKEAVIITIDDISCLAAIKVKNEYPDLKIYSFGNSLNLIGELENNELEALVVEDYFSMGYIATKQCEALIKGQTISPIINTDFTIVSKQTMFSKQTQWLLFSTK